MATVNFIPEHTQNASAMRGVIGYCQKEKKTVDEKSGRCLVSGINCNGENAYEEFMTTKEVIEFLPELYPEIRKQRYQKCRRQCYRICWTRTGVS